MFFGKIDLYFYSYQYAYIIHTKMSSGYLELWLGPMFSGKTTQLIQTYNKNTYIGKRVLVVNYADDRRYHDTMLSTHDKIMIPCVQSHCLSGLKEDFMKSDVIIINEGQFFHDLYEHVLELVDKHRKHVYICGLDGDFQRKKFGQVLDLIPHCDKMTKLNALCAICKDGTPAIFSKRITSENEQVVIGSDNYMPLCRTCYNVI
jgi:thymidine kinase